MMDGEDMEDNTVLYSQINGILSEVTVGGLTHYLIENKASREFLELLMDEEIKGHNRLAVRRIITAILGE